MSVTSIGYGTGRRSPAAIAEIGTERAQPLKVNFVELETRSPGQFSGCKVASATRKKKKKKTNKTKLDA